MNKNINLKHIENAGQASSSNNTNTFESAGLNSDEVKQPGAALLAMLYQQANEEGLQLKELAAGLQCFHPLPVGGAMAYTP